MSVATEHFYSHSHTDHAGVVGFWKEIPARILTGLGVAALGLYLALAPAAESLWPLLLGTVLLVGAALLTGLRFLRSAHAEPTPFLQGARDWFLRQAPKDVSSCGCDHQTVAATLESAVYADEPQVVIDDLKARIGNAGRKRAESAYMIGRQHMRLGDFGEAREWLRKARRNGRHFSTFDELVEQNLSLCNAQLLAEGDALYAVDDYHGARERYARLSQGLEFSEGQGLAVFLRSACVYCQLRDYERARPAVLHALKSEQQTDDALALLDLLQQLSDPDRAGMEMREARERIENRLRGCVALIMGHLRR